MLFDKSAGIVQSVRCGFGRFIEALGMILLSPGCAIFFRLLGVAGG